jgi:hypothetical protein
MKLSRSFFPAIRAQIAFIRSHSSGLIFRPRNRRWAGTRALSRRFTIQGARKEPVFHISQPRFSITMHDRLRHGTYVTNQKTGALQAHSAAKPLDGIRCDYAKAKAMALIGLPTAAQDTARGSSDEILIVWMVQRLLAQINGNEQDWIYERIPLPREQNRESWQSQHSQGTRGLPSVAKVTIQARSRGKDSVRLSTRHLVSDSSGSRNQLVAKSAAAFEKARPGTTAAPPPFQGGGAFLSC